MSVKSIDDFYLKLLDSPDLKEEILEAKRKFTGGKLSTQNAIEFLEKGLVPIAKKRGFNFSVDDLIDYESKKHFDLLKQKKNKLNDNDLNNINGGVALNFVNELFLELKDDKK